MELRRRYVAKIPRWRHPMVGYLTAVFLVGLFLLSSLLLQHFLGHFQFPATLFMLAVLFSALLWGTGPALFTLILSTIGLGYCFLTDSFAFFDHTWPERVTAISNLFDDWHTTVQLLPFVFSGLTIALITSQRERARLQALATEQDLQEYARELELINKRLEAADQSKDHFLSVASHELKTPITTIRGQAQMMLRRISKQAKSTSDVEGVELALERINEQTGRLTSLIDELLDVSSIRAGKTVLHKRSCDLRHLCRDVVDDQRLLTIRQIQLDVPAGPVKIEIDVDRISQVIINLVSNALKYSPDGSPVLVVVRAEKDHVLLMVSDKGQGIASDHLEHIFESFYRTPDAEASKKHGLGLGLAIAKDIVERHEGSIWCESEPGEGSTFYVKLPYKA
ncbi:hypothetical protein KTT_13540 [Tengunoibacter tsumagoiensis]|uniref:histidine kinase n=1 Tax=Tengunoibacter tsumagoiensis TaxID=2014871 RepID=A0A401ZXD5_9CHLR|nr:hypothetical protein KTT_13540 [Tengunoibacter tsumagoiensis]